MQDLNSNSFEFNSNGFELGLDKRKVQNVRIFGGAPENDKRIIGKVWRPNLKQKRDEIILQVCFGDFRNKEIFNIAP